MISEALRIDIERWLTRKDDNPMMRAAREGRMTPVMVTRYIANVTFMIRGTIPYMERARDRAREQGNATLASFFQHKLVEETGHAKWGDADLVSLTRMAAAPSATAVTSSIEALSSFIARTIEEDPALYLAYIAFSEYVVALAGDEFLTLLDERCGIPRTAMTVIDKHVELDKDHAEEGFGVIDDLVGDPRKLAPMRAHLAEVLRLFDAFCLEVTQVGAEDGRERRISAA